MKLPQTNKLKQANSRNHLLSVILKNSCGNAEAKHGHGNWKIKRAPHWFCIILFQKFKNFFRSIFKLQDAFDVINAIFEIRGLFVWILTGSCRRSWGIWWGNRAWSPVPQKIPTSCMLDQFNTSGFRLPGVHGIQYQLELKTSAAG